MDRSACRFGVAALASGLTLYVDSVEAPAIMLAIRESGLLSVQWERLGTADQLTQQLLREARCSQPDAWLIDGPIPVVVDRVRTIRESAGAIPILALSNDAPNAEALALAAGADAFCRWPEDADVLAHRVHALLRRASGVLNLAGSRHVELLHGTSQLRAGDQLIQLSSPEYVLLARLDKSRNAWVSSAELWELFVPEGARRHDSSLLRMHLLRLRRKLGPWSWVLRTERGRGTMLTDRPSTFEPATNP
jgi:DNA-binding response OmpR family regulator